MMAQYARRGTAILMGALFVLLLAPRELLHACGHAHAAFHHADGAGVSAPDHCPACDMVVPPFEQVAEGVDPVGTAFCIVLGGWPWQAEVQGVPVGPVARGPPVTA